MGNSEENLTSTCYRFAHLTCNLQVFATTSPWEIQKEVRYFVRQCRNGNGGWYLFQYATAQVIQEVGARASIVSEIASQKCIPHFNESRLYTRYTNTDNGK